MSQPSVTTTHGMVAGVRKEPTEYFLGIPYAAAPTGELRWKAPQPASDWTGVHQATQFGPACLQPRAPRAPESCLVDRPMSEDCLTLNIWRPAQREEGPLPVMVWFHGGAFRLGGTSLEQYDGSSLASYGVIVVTVNYRLGIFGVFPHPALTEPSANFGLLDQIAALGWVQRNIAAFGGDPDNVTAFGESAGGASVAYLMAAPAARGLFAKGIIQSGALDLPEVSRNAVADQMAAAMDGLSFPHASAAELRSVPAAMLLQIPLPRSATMPYVDGVVVPMKMTESFRQGAFARVPMLIGTNSFEAGFFGPAWYEHRTAENGRAMGAGAHVDRWLWYGQRRTASGADWYRPLCDHEHPDYRKGGHAASGSGLSLLLLLRIGFTTRHVARSHSHRRDSLRLRNSFCC